MTPSSSIPHNSMTKRMLVLHVIGSVHLIFLLSLSARVLGIWLDFFALLPLSVFLGQNPAFAFHCVDTLGLVAFLHNTLSAH